MKTAERIKIEFDNSNVGLNLKFEFNKPEKNTVANCLESTYEKFHTLPAKGLLRHKLTNILTGNLKALRLMLDPDDAKAFSNQINIEAIENAISAYSEHEGLEEDARLEAAGVTAEELGILDTIAQLHEAFELAANAGCPLFVSFDDDKEEPEKADSSYDDFDVVLKAPERFIVFGIVGSFLHVYTSKKFVICDPRKFKFDLQANLNMDTKTIVMNIGRVTGNNPSEFTYTFVFTNSEDGHPMMHKIQSLFEHIRQTQPAVYFE